MKLFSRCILSQLLNSLTLVLLDLWWETSSNIKPSHQVIIVRIICIYIASEILTKMLAISLNVYMYEFVLSPRVNEPWVSNLQKTLPNCVHTLPVKCYWTVRFFMFFKIIIFCSQSLYIYFFIQNTKNQ